MNNDDRPVVSMPKPLSHSDIVDQVSKYESRRKQQRLPVDGYEFKTLKKPTLLHKIHAIIAELIGGAI